MLETVCGNHCSMGWPWDGRHRIISSTPMRWDGAHLSSAGVLNHPLLYHEKLPQPLDIWWSKVTLHPVWQHNIVVVPNTISGFFQAPAATIKTPSPEYLWAGSESTSCWKVTGVKPKWPLVVSCCRSCFYFFNSVSDPFSKMWRLDAVLMYLQCLGQMGQAAQYRILIDNLESNNKY